MSAVNSTMGAPSQAVPTGKKKSKAVSSTGHSNQRISLLPALPPPRQNESAADAFAKALLKKSLAGLCMSSGFATTDAAALHALVQITKSKVTSISEELKSLAENSGRKRVTLEDYAEVIKKPAEAYSSSREPLQYLVGIPKFPVDPTPTTSQVTARDGESQGVPGLSHFPSLPPIHTYKRTRVDTLDLPSASTIDLRRAQQRNSALVRESLARMRPRSEAPGATNVSVPGEVDNLARLLEGDFES